MKLKTRKIPLIVLTKLIIFRVRIAWQAIPLLQIIKQKSNVSQKLTRRNNVKDDHHHFYA